MMVSAAHLTRKFDGRVAVEDLTFSIAPGEVFGLLGPNGAGKTTTMRMLAGLIQPSSGRITVAGVELTARTADAARERIGLLTESPGLWDRLPVWHNLLIYARLFGVADPAAATERFLRMFDLWERRTDQAALLSKGMRQKLALARALVHDPPVVLLDEPTSGLDPQTSRLVRELVLDLRRQGRAVLVSTHNLDEAERISDRIAVVQQRLIALDTPESLRRQLFGRRLRIGLDGNPAAFEPVLTGAGATDVRVQDSALSCALDDLDHRTPDLVRALVLAGARIREVSPEQQPLEEVYLKLISE
jgi:ABC-2 type transport system ATP-binding protein